MNITYFELKENDFALVTDDEKKAKGEKLDTFIRDIGIKISLTKPIKKVITKESMLKTAKNIEMSDLRKEIQSYIENVMPESIELTSMYAKVKTSDAESFKTRASEFFQIDEVSGEGLPYVASLFMNEENAFGYTLRYLRPSQPLELWDL